MIPNLKPCQGITIKHLEIVIGRKFVWGVDPQFTKQTELAFHEVNDLSKHIPELFVIPCPICYRVFLDQLGANYHCLLKHERYNLPKRSLDPRVKTSVKPKMTEYLKDSFFDCNFNKIFLNQINFTESMKLVDEIYRRSKPKQLEEEKADIRDKIEEFSESVLVGKYKNCEVSEYCESCKKSGLLITKPIPHNIVFRGMEIEYISDLTIGGDV